MQPSKYQILYIEDHDDTRELVTLVLEARGFKVTPGTTIKAALKLANKQTFDLYLLDTWLPDGSGFDLCERIREFDAVSPILFYSAAVLDSDKLKGIAAGAQGYLTKPCPFSELLGVVSKLIIRKEAPRTGEKHERSLATCAK